VASRPRSALKNRRQRIARQTAGGQTTLVLGVLMVFAVLGIVVFITPFAAAFAAYAYAADALSKLNFTSHEATFQTSRIYDRNGKLLYEFVDPLAGRRTQVPLAQIPEALRDATIAIEDKDFYTNPGFDVRGMARALYDDLTNRQLIRADLAAQAAGDRHCLHHLQGREQGPDPGDVPQPDFLRQPVLRR
jgi:membrane peptidoglycan carboxypeptidase